MKVVPQTAVRSLQDVREQLMLESVRTTGEIHQAQEKLSLLEARAQRLVERINAIDEAIFALREEE